MNAEQLFQVLTDIHPLTEDCKVAVKHELQFVAYPKGHYLVQARTVAQHVYFMEKGFSVSYIYRDGKRVVTDFFQPGEIILAPKSFFQQSPTDEIIQLTTDSRLLSISHESAIRLFDSFAVANYLARVITADYHARSIKKIIDLHTLTPWERYTELLQRYPRIELHVSQDLIASYLNINRSTLSRLRRKRN